MMMLAELLANFLPGKVKTRGAYLWSALLMTVLVVLVLLSVVRFYGQPWGTASLWAGAVAACVPVGYAVTYPFVRARLTGDR